MSIFPTVRLIRELQVEPELQELPADRVSAAKPAFSTRGMDLSRATHLIVERYQPKAGDLVLARVSRIGQHKRIERPDGRRAQLFAGDEVVVCYGNRYAPDQFEALVPEDLGPCELVAAGGIAAQVVCKHRAISNATRLQPIGVLSDTAGQPLNVHDAALPTIDKMPELPSVTAVVGTSMNAGKTTAAARLILGLARAGKKVAAAKITGTGAGGDYWMMLDAGAEMVVDFTDAGFATTYCLKGETVQDIMRTLLGHLAQRGVDAIVVELADGLLQSETRSLLGSKFFKQHVDQVMFAAGDAMGAVAGYQTLQQLECNIAAVSGAFTAAPLAVREVERELSCPVYQKTELSDPEIALSLIGETEGLKARDDEAACNN